MRMLSLSVFLRNGNVQHDESKLEHLYYETVYSDIYLGYTEQCHGNLSKRMPDLLGCHINL